MLMSPISIQNIFIGEDIRKQLPSESADFDGVNTHWKVKLNTLLSCTEGILVRCISAVFPPRLL